jgi:acyl-CoA dehydrogenase
LAALKEEDRAEAWYADWIAYQAEHGLYASVLSPKAYSTRGHEFDLLKLARFWEAASYHGPAHAYGLHVTFLGLFPLLRGRGEALKREAVAALEAGGLFAFAVSEQAHGADLLGNEFTVTEGEPGRFTAKGSKHYIGNAQAAAMVSVLARKGRRHGSDRDSGGSLRRAPMLFFALRPGDTGAVRAMRKIRTFGVRTAYVAAFEVDGYSFPASDVVCEGREAWESVFATVTLGKFFLGFSSIGTCEHAYAEAYAHVRGRMLYGKAVIEMPHVRSAMAHAYARLTAMKLFAYRALDYLHAAGPEERRYLLFAAVQKARVGTEGVKVMALLSECIGAKGFEADTYFESALREVPLVPALEGSTHINYETAAAFAPAYFARGAGGVASVPSVTVGGATAAGENPYLFEAVAGDVGGVAFADCLAAYRPPAGVRNVAIFTRQVRALRRYVRRRGPVRDVRAESEVVIAIGRCLSIVAFAQLVAEHCRLAEVEPALTSVLFHELIEDLSVETARLAALPQTSAVARLILAGASAVPRTTRADMDAVVARMGEGVA